MGEKRYETLRKSAPGWVLWDCIYYIYKVSCQGQILLSRLNLNCGLNLSFQGNSGIIMNRWKNICIYLGTVLGGKGGTNSCNWLVLLEALSLLGLF